MPTVINGWLTYTILCNSGGYRFKPGQLGLKNKIKTPQTNFFNSIFARLILTEENINDVLHRSKSANSATVVFSHPSETEFTVLTQNLAHIVTNVSPFIFRPFTRNEAPEIIIHPTHKNQDALNFIKNFQNTGFWQNANLQEISTTTFEEYSESFRNFQNYIQSIGSSKAVLSTVIKQPTPSSFNYGEFLLKLRKEYPGAFVYLFTSPFAGTWMGATPETLLKWQYDEISTMSLAGTRNIHSEAFGSKEHVEQQLVTSYIESFFAAELRHFNVAPLAELSYGNLVHLISKVSSKAPQDFSVERFLTLAQNLHPTPAVGGSPKKFAQDLIQMAEKHPRLYYSGYMGPVEGNNSHLYVNLRCMSVTSTTMYVFAGGGITAQSQLEGEWQETRLKANAMLKFV